MDDLVGSAEIAERLGLAHPEQVHAYRTRYRDFPEPVAQLAIGYVWNWPDIARWRERHPARPRQESPE